MTVLWITTIVIGALSVPFILVWWRLGDRWADSEHKRFKPRPGQTDRRVTDDAVTISTPAKDES